MKNLKGFQNTTPETFGKGITVTSKGKWYDLYNLNKDDINIDLIATSLSRQARYLGHTNQVISVAQHCYMLAQSFIIIGEVDKAYQALMHDASETWLSDVPRPLKKLIAGEYTNLEDKIEQVLSEKYKFKYPFDDDIMVADKNIAQYEMTVMMKHEIFSDYWSAEKAKKMFLEMFETIKTLKSYQ